MADRQELLFATGFGKTWVDFGLSTTLIPMHLYMCVLIAPIITFDHLGFQRRGVSPNPTINNDIPVLELTISDHT